MNSVNLIGNLVRDAELKHTQNGTAICKMAIAVNERFKQGDEWVERPNFIDLVLWGKRGESLAQYLTKGSKIGIIGRLRQNKWEDKDGNGRSKIEVVVGDVDLLGGKRDTVNQGKSQYQANQGASQYEEDQGDFEDDEPWKDDSGIPF